MMQPLWWGEGVPEGWRPRKNGESARQRALAQSMACNGEWTYIAVSPCGQYAKIGRSRVPLTRLSSGQDIRVFQRHFGIGRAVLVRAYPGNLERTALAAVAPDRVGASYGREWCRVGPRLRVLVARLDREHRESPRRLP